MSEIAKNHENLSERDEQVLIASEEEIPEHESTDNFEIAKAEKGTPEHETAIAINLEGDETDEQIRQLVKEKLPEHFWWCAPRWKEKGQPREEIVLTLESGRKINLYNWFRPLTEQELQELNEVVSLFAAIDEGRAVRSVGYVLINGDQPTWKLETGDPVNGYGRITGKRDHFDGIELYPNAFSGIHRAANISNFKGTLIHESTHHIAPIGGYLYNEWIDDFGWQSKDPEDIERRNARCITEYAKTKPDEDICDSVTAKVGKNSSLDVDKEKFLEERIFARKTDDKTRDMEHWIGKDVKLPELPKTIYYRQAPKITIIVEEEEPLSE